MVIAGNMLAFAGLAQVVDVWTGHSKDVLHRVHWRYKGKDKLRFQAVFTDQKGSRYVEDLEKMEDQGLLLPDALVRLLPFLIAARRRRSTSHDLFASLRGSPSDPAVMCCQCAILR